MEESYCTEGLARQGPFNNLWVPPYHGILYPNTELGLEPVKDTSIVVQCGFVFVQDTLGWPCIHQLVLKYPSKAARTIGKQLTNGAHHMTTMLFESSEEKYIYSTHKFATRVFQNESVSA